MENKPFGLRKNNTFYTIREQTSSILQETIEDVYVILSKVVPVSLIPGNDGSDMTK